MTTDEESPMRQTKTPRQRAVEAHQAAAAHAERAQQPTPDQETT